MSWRSSSKRRQSDESTSRLRGFVVCRFTSGAPGTRLRMYDVTEADLIRWTGVIAGVFGGIVAAPTGAMLILLDVWAVILAAWAAIRRVWNRFTGRKKEPASATYALGGSAAAQSTAAGALIVRHHGAPLDVQIRQLWEEFDRLYERITQADGQSEQARDRHGKDRSGKR